MARNALTPTHFAVLCLLSTRSWTAYELVHQVQRSVGAVWPRAQSNVYADLKRIATDGYAIATVDHVGRRPRTAYSITDDGRAALRAWLLEPGEAPVFACEALLKLSFAPAVTKAAALRQIDVIQRHADERLAFGRMLAEQHIDGSAPMPERLHINAVLWRYLWEMHEAMARWAAWAHAEVTAWPDTRGGPAQRTRGRQVLIDALL